MSLSLPAAKRALRKSIKLKLKNISKESVAVQCLSHFTSRYPEPARTVMGSEKKHGDQLADLLIMSG